MKIDKEYFWTDSSIVLGYIKNETKVFKKFVSNRVAYIRSCSNANDWRHVPTKMNIADIATRQTSIKDFMNNKEWLDGPEFLYKQENQWPATGPIKTNLEVDKELAKENKVMVQEK